MFYNTHIIYQDGYKTFLKNYKKDLLFLFSYIRKRIKKIYEPRKETQKIYGEMFELYRESYSRLKSVFHSLAEIKDTEELL